MRNDEVLHLASLGYHLVPWANRRNENPKPLVKGWLTSEFSSDTIQKFTSIYPEADWAVVPRAAVVLDLECKNGLDGIADLERLCADHGGSYAEITAQCAITRTKSNGRHVWFRAPEACALKGGQHITSGIEIKRINGSCHVPPSMGYSWIQPLGAVSTLPVLPEWLLALWKEARIEANSTSPKLRVFANGERNLAMCAFAAEARRTLGLDKNEMREFLSIVRRTRCENPETFAEEEAHKIADHYASRDVDGVSLLAANGDETAQSVIRFIAKLPDVAATVEYKDDTAVIRYPELATEDLRPTALINEIVGWQIDNSPSPQPELSLLSTLTAIGTVLGKTWSVNREMPSIYGMALAPTGQGKDAPKNMLEAIVTAAGLGNIISGNIASGAGFLTHLLTVPELLWCEDEFGYKMKALSRKDSAAYMQDLMQKALTAYTGSTIQPKVTKDESTEVVYNPFVNLYGSSQVSFFWDNCSLDFVQTGLVNRLTLVMGRKGLSGEEDLAESIKFYDRLNADDEQAPQLQVPEHITTILSGVRGNQSALSKLTGGTKTARMPMDQTVRHYMAHKWHEAKTRQHKIDPASPSHSICARDGQKICRFALIHAWSLNPDDPRVTKESVDWAARFVEYSTGVALAGYESRLNLVLSKDEEVDAVYSRIAKTGADGITQTELSNSMRRLHKVLDKILDTLVKSEKIILKLSRSTGTKPRRTWYATTHAAQVAGDPS